MPPLTPEEAAAELAKRKHRRPGSATYESHKKTTAARQAAQAAAGRDIGQIPDIADVGRRDRCRYDFGLFGRTYNSAAYAMPFSQFHLDGIKKIEDAVLLGALYAFAWPRGSGKTVNCRMAVLWAASYAHRQYPFLIGSNAEKGEDALTAIKTYMRYLPLYVADFPEIAYPIMKLSGIAHRANGQTSLGVSTAIGWNSDRITLPTVAPPANWPQNWALRSDGMVPSSGTVISVSGLTGEGIRGSLLTLTTGESIRPDLVLLDDPQSDESARSKLQNESRERLISGAVLGMAGPGKTISAVMPCTVIEQGDMVDNLLDRSKHPLWRGERTSMLRSMPSNLEAWEKYFDVYRSCALREPPDYADANAYYEANRLELDAGAEASWLERKLPGDVSAIQHAMNLFARDRRAFFAEYQNRPELAEDGSDQRKQLDAGDVANRLSGIQRHIVPDGATRLTAFIDTGNLLWYAICAWDERYGGSVIDYGSWPRQSRNYFGKRDAQRQLAEQYPGLTEDQQLYAGLRDLTANILGRGYFRASGDSLRVERCLVDEGWKDGVIYQFCRESPHSAILMPSKGYAVKVTAPRTMNEWVKREGERVGPYWRLGPSKVGKGRHVLFDPNYWKTFAAERLSIPPGGGSDLSLFGSDPAEHRMIAEHLSAEFATAASSNGRTSDYWESLPQRDNDLLDCVVGCTVAASIQGISLSASGGIFTPQRRQKIKLSERLAKSRAKS